MPKFVRDLLAIFSALISLVISAEQNGVPGPEKRRSTLEAIKKILSEPNGLDFPKFLTNYQDVILGVMIDAIVSLLNKSGFFEKSSDS